MFKKIGMAFLVVASLSSSIEASYGPYAPLDNAPAAHSAPPSGFFYDPYYTGSDFAREKDIAQKIRAFVLDSASAFDTHGWIGEFKKHLVQCDNLAAYTECMGEGRSKCTLSDFIFDILAQLPGAQTALARQRIALVGEAFNRWRPEQFTLIQAHDALVRLQNAVTEACHCYGKDRAVFEGRLAYIKRRCSEYLVNVTETIHGDTIEDNLSRFGMSPDMHEAVASLKRAIALGQIQRRNLQGFAQYTHLEELYLKWELETAYLDAPAGNRHGRGGFELITLKRITSTWCCIVGDLGF